MNNAAKISIVIILCAAIIFGVFSLVKKNTREKLISEANQVIAEYDSSARFSYDNLDINNILSPTQLVFSDVRLKSENYTIAASEAVVDLSDEKITYENLELDIINDAAKEANLGYKIMFSERVQIVQSPDKENSYNINLPDSFELDIAGERSVANYLPGKKPITLTLDNNKDFQSFYYEDQGVTMDSAVEGTGIKSESTKNIIDVKKTVNADADSYEIIFISNENTYGDRQAFNINVDTSFSKAKTDDRFETYLDIRDFSVSFANYDIKFSGELFQNWQNFIPYGDLKFSFSNFKVALDEFFTEGFLEGLAADPQIAQLITDTSTEDKQKFVKFLSVLNNSDSDDLLLNITRNSAEMPTVNDYTVQQLEEFYNKIFLDSDTSSEEELPELR